MVVVEVTHGIVEVTESVEVGEEAVAHR
jgi:hypothetical protein